MSDTPRTDRAIMGGTVSGSFARRLERELAAATARAERAEAERDNAKGALSSFMDHMRKVEELRLDADLRANSFEAKLDAARAALRKFARHARDCGCMGGIGFACTCGLGAALADGGEAKS